MEAFIVMLGAAIAVAVVVAFFAVTRGVRRIGEKENETTESAE